MSTAHQKIETFPNPGDMKKRGVMLPDRERALHFLDAETLLVAIYV
jgi:hypothetical protein